MLLTDQHPNNKNLMVAVLGEPNVGKSTFINEMLGQDLSIVTSKPQTTRNKFHCVCTVDRTELVFVDTPGLHKSGQEFNKRLNQQALEGIHGVDLNLLLVSADSSLQTSLKVIRHQFQDVELGKSWLVINKTDLAPEREYANETILEQAQECFPQIEKVFFISAKKGDNIHLLTGALCDLAKPGPHHYPMGDMSNKNMRFFVSEYIREQAFELLNEELPYEIAVVIEDYSESEEASRVSAAILVNRPSQRAIVVGSGGKMIKEIGIRARKRIEDLTGAKVHLNLHVKISPKWYKNNFVLQELGLPRAQNSARVWRSS